jgi:hypothetical protein
MMNIRKISITVIIFFSVTVLSAQKVTERNQTVCGLDTTYTRVQTPLHSAMPLEFKRIGTLKSKNIHEMETSMWSLGCETLDRGHASWENYRDFLEPLGIRHIRVQGGWHRTEKVKGVYDFAWLDSIVNDAHALGLKVCLETSYMNRLYDENARIGPGPTLPDDEKILKAWDEWVMAMAKRYSGMGVTDWMMINEPNLKRNDIREITDFNIRTAEIIKRIDPDARIGGLVLANAKPDVIESFLKILKEKKKDHLFYWVIYHGYATNPDDVNPKVEEIKNLIEDYAPQLRLWQGEAGCSSEEAPYALSGIDWTELSHAKWNARRMLSDQGQNVMSSVFTISDLSYRKDFIARYGLLKTNPDNSIIKVKMAYYMVQNVVSVFNDAVALNPDYNMEIVSDRTLSWHAFKDKKSGLDLVTFWDGTEIPSNDIKLGKASFLIKNGNFNDPVWMDLITGNIYEIPEEQWTKDGSVYIFHGIPVYDGPSVITDKSLLNYVPARVRKTSAHP